QAGFQQPGAPHRVCGGECFGAQSLRQRGDGHTRTSARERRPVEVEGRGEDPRRRGAQRGSYRQGAPLLEGGGREDRGGRWKGRGDLGCWTSFATPCASVTCAARSCIRRLSSLSFASVRSCRSPGSTRRRSRRAWGLAAGTSSAS